MSETYTDRSGRTITRARALEMATDCILSQGDARPMVEAYVERLLDGELMEWLVYPDYGDGDPTAGNFPDDAFKWATR